jgi:Flp pilus assembly protein CpaB
MRRSRMLFIVGGILIVGAIAVGAIFMLRRPRDGGDQTPTPEGQIAPTPEYATQIVVAAQDIPPGVEITEDMIEGEAPAVILKGWPEDEVPAGAIYKLEDVVGYTTRVDVTRDLPILATMLVEEPSGSQASVLIPEGHVAYALPVARYSSVAWALQPGDYVDLMISLLLVDMDEEFQSATPNQARCLSPSDDPACAGMGGTMGRLEVMPNGWLVNLLPSESQRARLVTQLTIQNALVLRVGDWPISGEEEPEPVATEELAGGAEEEAPVEGEVQSQTAPSLAPLTLAVSRQDAMILEYAQLTGARVTFVLRKKGENDRATTESVTFQYLMDRFNIEMPPKLPYGVLLPVTTLGVYNFREEVSFNASGVEPEQ